MLTPGQFTKMQTMEASRRQRGADMMPDGKVKDKDGKMKIKTKTDS